MACVDRLVMWAIACQFDILQRNKKVAKKRCNTYTYGAFICIHTYKHTNIQTYENNFFFIKVEVFEKREEKNCDDK